MTTDQAPETAPTSKAAWKSAKRHEGVTLPSGQVVAIVLPNLATLIKSGELPNSLIDEAIELQQAKKITRDALVKSWEFTRFIVPRTVVDSVITEDDVEDLPISDVELLAAFATRNTDMDAVNHQLGGLETVKSFRNARGIYSLDEVLEDID